MILTPFAAGIICDHFERRALRSLRATAYVVTARTKPRTASTS